MNSNLSFQDFWPTFDWNQYNMLMSAKGQVYFQILSCYFINVRLTILLQVCFKLNKYKNNKKGEFQFPFPRNLFNLRKGQLLHG